MCTFTYEWENTKKGCGLNSRIDLELPVDSDDLCIFHSEQRDWKYDNDCFHYFIELIVQSNKGIKPIHFHGMKLTGHTSEQHGQKEMFDGGAIIFGEGVIKKELVFLTACFMMISI